MDKIVFISTSKLKASEAKISSQFIQESGIGQSSIACSNINGFGQICSEEVPDAYDLASRLSHDFFYNQAQLPKTWLALVSLDSDSAVLRLTYDNLNDLFAKLKALKGSFVFLVSVKDVDELVSICLKNKIEVSLFHSHHSLGL